MAGLPGRRRYTTVHLGDTPFGWIWPVIVKNPGHGHIGRGRIGPLPDHGKLYCITGSSHTCNFVPPGTHTSLVASRHDCPFRIISNARRHVHPGRSRECVSRYRGPRDAGKGDVRLPVKISSHPDGRERSWAALAHPPAGFWLRTERRQARIARKLSHTLSRISCDIADRR
jgi:hypothetical protein